MLPPRLTVLGEAIRLPAKTALPAQAPGMPEVQRRSSVGRDQKDRSSGDPAAPVTGGRLERKTT